MNPADSSLQALRPLHLPDPISWWPPAPGWWWAALLIILLIALMIYWWRRGAVRRAALSELRRLKCAVEDPRQRISALALLLRRYAIAAYPDRPVAGLTGEAWLEFLDAQGGDGRFLGGPGRLLIEAPFNPDAGDDDQEVIHLVGRWIRANRVHR